MQMNKTATALSNIAADIPLKETPNEASAKQMPLPYIVHPEHALRNKLSRLKASFVIRLATGVRQMLTTAHNTCQISMFPAAQLAADQSTGFPA